MYKTEHRIYQNIDKGLKPKNMRLIMDGLTWQFCHNLIFLLLPNEWFKYVSPNSFFQFLCITILNLLCPLVLQCNFNVYDWLHNIIISQFRGPFACHNLPTWWRRWWRKKIWQGRRRHKYLVKVLSLILAERASWNGLRTSSSLSPI